MKRLLYGLLILFFTLALFACGGGGGGGDNGGDGGVSKVSTPTFSPAAGTYTIPQSVTISTATAGASIFYTTNGVEPTLADTLYTGPIAVSVTTTVKAIAAKSGMTDSDVGSAAYTMNTPAGKVATPTFYPPVGTYTSGNVNVAISTATSEAIIYYTTNWTTPTTSSNRYSEPILLNGSKLIKAIAVKSGMSDSDVGSASYNLKVVAPIFGPAAGTYTKGQGVTITTTTSGATIYYTTNGSTPTTSSTLYAGTINVSDSSTVKAIAIKSGWTDSDVSTASYVIENIYTLVNLPDTGQTNQFIGDESYSCAGTGLDCEFTINPPSYTDNGDGTVTDNVTGLMWQQADDGILRTWDEAKTYCGNLALGGYSDWRLPGRHELVGIVDYGTFSPAINSIFSSSSAYWSFNTSARYPGEAWYVNFRYGNVSYYDKTVHACSVRCVR